MSPIDELKLLEEIDGLMDIDCPAVLMTLAQEDGSTKSNCPLGEENCLCKVYRTTIVVKTPTI